MAIGAPNSRESHLRPLSPFEKARGLPVVWHHGRVTIPLPQREPDTAQPDFAHSNPLANDADDADDEDGTPRDKRADRWSRIGLRSVDKRGDPRKNKRIEDLLRRVRNKGHSHLFKYAGKLNEQLLADEDRHIGPNQMVYAYQPVEMTQSSKNSYSLLSAIRKLIKSGK